MVAITLEQVQDQAGIVVDVKVDASVASSIHCVFTDAVHNNSITALDQVIIQKSRVIDTIPVNGVKTFQISFSASAYAELTNGAKINLKVTAGTDQKAVLGPLTYFQEIPFELLTVSDGIESADIKVQLDNAIYLDNKTDYRAVVTVYQAGLILVDSAGEEIDFGVVISVPNATGEFDVTLGMIPGKRLPTGTYEVAITIQNSIGSNTQSKVVVITTDPSSVEATSFNTFDASGPMFQLDYGAKDYSGYTGLKLYASFSQKDNADAALKQYTVATDICGVTFATNAPSQYIMDSAVASALVKFNVEATATVVDKFDVEFWLSGSAILDVSAGSHIYTGAKTKSSFWLDQELKAPTLSLDEIDWTTGVQTVKIGEVGSFDGYDVYYDLSGNKSNGTMDACGTTFNSSATKSYSYDDLEPVANGDYKVLSVSVERPEINNLDAITPPMNKSPASTLGYLKAVKRATAPEVVKFTEITSIFDGSIEFAYIEASGNTDLYGVLMGGLNASGELIILEALSGTIPTADASNTILSFDKDLEAGVQYIMNAYSRFDLSDDYNNKYKVLNGNSSLLLSAVTSDKYFFTLPPTMTLTVRPSAGTNDLNTVRMEGDANANNITRMIVYAKDVCGQVLESEVIVGNDFADSCGNVVLNSGGNIDNFNTSFIQDFVFDTTVSIDSNGGMFLLGIIDTPNEVDAIQVDQEASTLTTAFNSAVIAYDAGVISHTNTLDACNNYVSNAEYIVQDNLLTGWTASADDLNALLLDISGDIAGDKNVSGSILNVADLLSKKNAEALTLDAMGKTSGSMNVAINGWINATPPATASEATKLAHKFDALDYTVFTVSGEALAQTDGELTPPVSGFSSTYLSTIYNDSQVLYNAQNVESSNADVLHGLAVTENTRLNSIMAGLNANVNTASSILYAKAQVAAALLAMGVITAALYAAYIASHNALYGIAGTAAEPKDGSLLKNLNEARIALGN